MHAVAGTLATDPSDQPASLASAAQGVAPPPSAGSDPFPGAEWSHGDPAKMGWSVDGLAAAKAYADRVGSTSGMIVQHGVVVDEWGDTARKSALFSVRKSLVSALIGIAVGRGQMHLDQTLAELGIDDNPPSLTAIEKTATVREMIEARSGVYHPTVYETPWMLSIKPARGTHAPGEFWVYNNWDFNTAGAIYEKLTGQRIFDALKTEIANPIGMQDYQPSDGRYASGEPGSRYPAYPLKMSARDLARFGLLFLRNGRWRDQQVIPAEWVAESTRPYSDTPYGGYGYMWWTSNPAVGPRGPGATITLDAYWADGHLGQYAIVVPSLDLVVINRVDPKLTHKRVEEQQKAKLLWLIESASGATDMGPEPRIVNLGPLSP
jgi:CubicO group peptidase (beta-lactamase class C family)